MQRQGRGYGSAKARIWQRQGTDMAAPKARNMKARASAKRVAPGKQIKLTSPERA